MGCYYRPKAIREGRTQMFKSEHIRGVSILNKVLLARGKSILGEETNWAQRRALDEVLVNLKKGKGRGNSSRTDILRSASV